MTPIVAVQAAAPDLPDAANAGTANAGSDGSAANAFLALFTQALSEKGAPVDPAALLLAGGDKVVSAHGGGDAKAGKAQEGTDPAAMAMMQSLSLPALMANLDSTSVSKTQADSATDTTISVQVGADSGQKLPSRLATIAEQLLASRAGDQTKTDPLGVALGDMAKDANVNFGALVSSVVAKSGSAPGQVVPQHSSGDGQTGLSSQLQMLSGAHPMTTSPSAVVADKPVMTMQAGFGTPAWQQELGDKVAWMASNQGGHVSNLVLNPPSMGTVEIRLHVQGSEAGAQFYAANPDVRNALEQAMPRLREMMANAGIALGDTMVSNQSFSQRDSSQSQSERSGSKSGSTFGISALAGPMEGASLRTGHLSAGNTLLDYYA